MPLGKLYYRALEKEKTSLLKEKCENSETKILSLNKHAIEELKWWLGAIPNAKNSINTPQVDFEINTYAGETGWGATEFGGLGQKKIRTTTSTTCNY